MANANWTLKETTEISSKVSEIEDKRVKIGLNWYNFDKNNAKLTNAFFKQNKDYVFKMKVRTFTNKNENKTFYVIADATPDETIKKQEKNTVENQNETIDNKPDDEQKKQLEKEKTEAIPVTTTIDMKVEAISVAHKAIRCDGKWYNILDNLDITKFKKGKIYKMNIETNGNNTSTIKTAEEMPDNSSQPQLSSDTAGKTPSTSDIMQNVWDKKDMRITKLAAIDRSIQYLAATKNEAPISIEKILEIADIFTAYTYNDILPKLQKESDNIEKKLEQENLSSTSTPIPMPFD